MVEEVVDAIFKRIRVENPAFVGNLNAELMLFVALRGQGREGVLARGQAAGVVKHGSGDGEQGRGLEEVAVKAAQHPAQARNFNRGADAGIDGGFVESAVVDGEALAAQQGEVPAQAQVVVEIKLAQRGVGMGSGIGLGGCAAVVDLHAEEVALRLVKRVEAGGEAVRASVEMTIGLAAQHSSSSGAKWWLRGYRWRGES